MCQDCYGVDDDYDDSTWDERDDYDDQDEWPGDRDDLDDRYDEYKDHLAMGYINPDGSQRDWREFNHAQDMAAGYIRMSRALLGEEAGT